MNPATQLSFSWSLNTLLLVSFSALILYALSRVIYHLTISPLSAVPGPWYAAVSDFWLVTHVLRFQQCKTVHTLFEKYGPVVRVGPNKIVFCDFTSMKSVYSVHKFDKSAYYKSLLTNDNDHAMTTLDHASHLVRRKAYASHYSPSNIALFQPEMRDAMIELVKTLEHTAGATPLDCLSMFRRLLVDVLVSSCYGYRLGAVSSMNPSDPLSTSHELCAAIKSFPIRGVIRSAVPTWLWNRLCRIPNKQWRQICDSDKVMAEFVGARVYEMRAQMNSGRSCEAEKVPLLHRLLRYRYSSTDSTMPDLDIISETMGHMIAGSDTSSTSLSYFFWELSRRADIMRKLQAELDDAMTDAQSIPDISVLQRLPYLNAFIKEGLRLYGAAPSLLERVVPSSTSKNALDDEIFDLMGYALPPGTIVSTQAWSMHRDPSVFPCPDTFLPERWLETPENGEDLIKMSQYMMPFGTGSRVCGGQNFAQMTLRIAVAVIARNFDIEAPPETNDKTMEMRDSFVIFPASMECKLIFHPRKQ